MVSEILHSPSRRETAPALTDNNSFNLVGKRVFDIVFALFVTIFILSWMLPLVSLLIWITSPGPALFIQWRTGHNRRHFRCLKFRTMRHRPEESFRQATRYDNRVTRIGSYLRRTNLDEMPQFLNVLMGDMSVVGPRPHAVQHDAEHWSMQGYSERYRVRPGITGLAQVRGCRGETSELIRMKHRLRFDRYYIQKASFLLDMRICWWTVKQMVRGNKNVW